MIRKVVSRGARKLGKFSKKASKGLASRAGGKVKAGGQHAKKSIFPSGKKSTSSKFASKAGKLGAKSLWLAGKWGTKGLWHLTKAFPHGTITALCIVLLLILAVAIFIILAAYGTFSPGQLAANRTDDIPGGPWTAHTSDVPEQYKQLYIDASIEHNVPWQILVAWGDVATNHGKRSPYDCIWRVDPDSPAAWSEDMKDAFGENTIVYEYIKSKNLRPPYGNETEPQEYPLNPVGWSPYSSQANCANGGSASGWLYQWCPEISNLPDDSPDPPIAPNILYNSPLTPYEKREGRTVRYVDNFHPYLPVIGKNRFTANPLGIAEECRLPAPTSTNTINDGSAIAWYPEGPGTQSYFTRSWRVKWIGNTTKDYCGPMLLQPSATGVSCRELQSASRSINIVAETISVVLDSMNYDTKCQAVEGSELCSLEGQLTAYDNSLIHPPPILSADNHIPELLRRSTLYYPGYWGRIVAETLILLRSDGFHKRSFVERITGSNQKHEVGLLNRSDHYNALMMGGINCENRGGPWADGDSGWETSQDIYHTETRTSVPGIDEFTAALVCELDATGPGTYFDWRAGGLPNEGAASSKLASSLWAKDLMDASWAWSQWGTKNGKNGCVNAGKVNDSATLTYQYSGIYLPFPPMEANGNRPYSICDMHFVQNRTYGNSQSGTWEGLRPVIDKLFTDCRATGNYIHCAPLERYLISMFPFTFENRTDINTGSLDDKYENIKFLPAIPDYNPYRRWANPDDKKYDFPWAGKSDGDEWATKIIEWCGFTTKDDLDDSVINPKYPIFNEDASDSQKEAATNTFACILYLSALVYPNGEIKTAIIDIANQFLETETYDNITFSYTDGKGNDINITCWYHPDNFGRTDTDDYIDCEELIGVLKPGNVISPGNALHSIAGGYVDKCENNNPDIKYPCVLIEKENNGSSEEEQEYKRTAYGENEVEGEKGEMINAAWYVRALHAGVAPWPDASMFPDNSKWEVALANIIASRDLSIFTADEYIGPKPDASAPPEIAAIESRYAELSDEIDMKTPGTYEAGMASAAIQYLGWGGFGNAVKVTSSQYAEHDCGSPPAIRFSSSVGESTSITTPTTGKREKTRTYSYLYKLHIREKIDKYGGICIPQYTSLNTVNGITLLSQGTEPEDRWSGLHDNTNTIWDETSTTAQIIFEPDFAYSEKILRNIADSINTEFKNENHQVDTNQIIEHFSSYTAQSIIDNSDSDTDDFSLPLAELIYHQPADTEDESTEKNYVSLDLSNAGACRFVIGGGDLLKGDSELWWECIWTLLGDETFSGKRYNAGDNTDESHEPPTKDIDKFPSWVIQIPYRSMDGGPVHGSCYLISKDTEEPDEDDYSTKDCFVLTDDNTENNDIDICGTRKASDMYAMWRKIFDEDAEKKNCEFIRNRTFRKEGNRDCGSPYNYNGNGTRLTIFTAINFPCKQIETVPWMARGWNMPSPWDEKAVRATDSGNEVAPYDRSIFETATWPMSSSKTADPYIGDSVCDPSTSEGSGYWGSVEKFGNPSPVIPRVTGNSGKLAIRRKCYIITDIHGNTIYDMNNRPLIPSISYPSVKHISPHRWVGWSDQVFTEEKANKCNLGGSLEYERNETCWHAGLEIAHRARWMAGGIQAEDGPPVILPHDCHPDYRNSVSSQPQLVPTNSPESCILGDSGMEIYATQPWISDRHFCKGAQDGRYHDGTYLTRKNIADGEDEKIKVKNKFVDCGYGKDVEKPERQLSLRENGVTCINREMGFIPSGDVCRRASAMYDAAASNGVTLIASSHTTPQQQLNKRKTNCSGNGITEQKLLYDKTIKCSAPTALPRSRYSWHEMGSALDFTVSGDRNKCPDAEFWKMLVCENDADFFWLFLNAYRFGFQNLPSEPWHWSPMGA